MKYSPEEAFLNSDTSIPVPSVNEYLSRFGVVVFIFRLNVFLVVWCPAPTGPTHRTVLRLSQPCVNAICKINTLVIFACDPEYFLVGYGYTQCVGYGNWSLPFPTCEGILIFSEPRN